MPVISPYRPRRSSCRPRDGRRSEAPGMVPSFGSKMSFAAIPRWHREASRSRVVEGVGVDGSGRDDSQRRRRRSFQPTVAATMIEDLHDGPSRERQPGAEVVRRQWSATRRPGGWPVRSDAMSRWRARRHQTSPTASPTACVDVRVVRLVRFVDPDGAARGPDSSPASSASRTSGRTADGARDRGRQAGPVGRRGDRPTLRSGDGQFPVSTWTP